MPRVLATTSDIDHCQPDVDARSRTAQRVEMMMPVVMVLSVTNRKVHGATSRGRPSAGPAATSAETSPPG